MRRLVPVWFAVTILSVMISFSSVGVGSEIQCCPPPTGRVVNKAPGQAFTVEISFKNVGSMEGSWLVNVALEGEKWTWKGRPQPLMLEPELKRTLTWNGTVSKDVPIDSTTRLIVYYDESYTPLDWWIHIVPVAELAIAGSAVR